MSKIRWLHISDLHIRANESAEWNLLQKQFPFPPISFLVFTGDLHQFGQDYEKSLDFLRRLAKQYKLNSNDIFIVPGNHDVDADQENAEYWARLANERLDSISNTAADVLDQDNRPLTERFSQYCVAVQSLVSRKDFSYPWAGVFCREWRKKVNVIHLNTALLSCKETQLQQITDVTALAGLTLKNPHLPVIVLAHHNFYRLSDAQYKLLVTCFRRLNVRAYLHGDIHKGREAPILLDNGRQIPCIAAPSIYRNPADSYSETGAYLYEWDLDSPQGKVKVVPYQWQDFELKPAKSVIESFDMQSIEQGLWQTYQEKTSSLDLGMLPGIIYGSRSREPNVEEYENIGDAKEQPMIRLFQKHSDERYFQLIGSGKQACGGTGKTSTLLSMAAALTSPNWKRQQWVPLYFSLKDLYGLNKKSREEGNRLVNAAAAVYQIEWDKAHPSLLFLLDGFNEIFHPVDRTRCLQDIQQITKEFYPDDAVIITSRDPLSSYISLGECDAAFDYDQLDEWTIYFRNCYVQALSEDQKNRYVGEPKPSPDDQIWSILDTPFYLARYHNTKMELGMTARRWLTPAFEQFLQKDKPEKTTLMLQLMLREINRLSSGVSVVEAERQCFILMKVLPFLGYRQVLSDRLGSDLSTGPRLHFRRADIYRCTYDCLNACLTQVELWPEYCGDYAEKLEMYWDNFCELYENDKKPRIGALEKQVPYSTFLFGLLIYSNGVSHFCHDNYRDFFAALHIANVVYLLSSGFGLSDQKPEVQEVLLLQVEVFDHSILLDAEMILEQYFGLHFENELCFTKMLDCAQDKLSRLVLLHILIRFLEASAQSITRKFGSISDQRLFIYRSSLYMQFKELFELIQPSFDQMTDRYGQFYVYALAMLARDYRTGKSGERNLIKCAGFAQLTADAEKRFNVPKADGYLQLGLCINAYMEDLLNGRVSDFYPRMPHDLALAKKIYHAVTVYSGSRNEYIIQELMRPLLGKRCKYTADTLGCSDIFSMMLSSAYEKYRQAGSIHAQKIAEFGFISKAYLILAAIGTSGGAFNTLAQMLLNQANQLEADPRLTFFRANPEDVPHQDSQDLTYSLNGNGHFVLAFRLLLVVCNIRRGSQPYSHSKAAELILKGRVTVRTQTDGTLVVSDNADGVYVSGGDSWVESALNKAIGGDNTMAYYWKGRYYLELANRSPSTILKNEYQKMAIDCFQATRAVGFPYQSYLEGGSAPVPVKWLSAMELLAFPEEISFLCDPNQVYQAIYQCLSAQVKAVGQEQITLKNEAYRLTKQDVLENVRRFRGISSIRFESSYVFQIDELLHRLDNLDKNMAIFR